MKLGVQSPPPTVTIKLSGDGAVIAASSTMVFLTFSFPDLSENVLSAKVNKWLSVDIYYNNLWHTENHTFASVRGQEEYEFLKACFEPVWKELQELIEHPSLCINETETQPDIVFGADYKVGHKTALSIILHCILKTTVSGTHDGH